MSESRRLRIENGRAVFTFVRMKTWLRLFCFAVATFVLSGCSVITRPPSAAAFMDSYREDYEVNTFTFSVYKGDLVSDYQRVDYLPSPYDVISEGEWVADFSFLHYFNASHFTMGLGLQSITPILQPGYVSRYFGVMGWTNMLPLPERIDEGNGKTAVGWTGGISLIEQWPLTDNFRIGLTEHVSRNGRESYWKESDCGGGFGPTGACMGDAKSIVYMEIGAGGYISLGRFSFEFRYGRDLSENRNRFTFSLDVSLYSGRGFAAYVNDEIENFKRKKIF